MAIYRNKASQKLAVFAYTPADGAAKTGDASNITAYLSKDWATPAAITDTNPTEMDSSNMPGWYVFDLTQAETDAEVLVIAPQSATAGVVLDQVQVFTLDATISSRAPAATALANAIWTDAKADYLDEAISAAKTLTGDYDAAKSAAAPGAQMDIVNAPNATAIAAIQSGLAPAATALSNATWTDGRAALLDYLDAAITSRLATAGYTAPDNAGITTLLDRLTAARAGYLDKLNVSGTLAHSDAANLYRADVSALATAAALDALDVLIDAIKAKTDQMTFTVANKVDATAEASVDEEAIADAVIAGMGDLVDDVWSHSQRTLTQIGVAPAPTTTADEISRRRGDSWEIAISGLSLAGYTEVWFTVKRGYGYTDADALLMVTETGGLVRLNGAATEAGDVAKAALVVNAGNDMVTVTVEAEIDAQLATGTFVYDLQWMDSEDNIYTVSAGALVVYGDVTRATS